MCICEGCGKQLIGEWWQHARHSGSINGVYCDDCFRSKRLDIKIPFYDQSIDDLMRFLGVKK